MPRFFERGTRQNANWLMFVKKFTKSSFFVLQFLRNRSYVESGAQEIAMSPVSFSYHLTQRSARKSCKTWLNREPTVPHNSWCYFHCYRIIVHCKGMLLDNHRMNSMGQRSNEFPVHQTGASLNVFMRTLNTWRCSLVAGVFNVEQNSYQRSAAVSNGLSTKSMSSATSGATNSLVCPRLPKFSIVACDNSKLLSGDGYRT